MRIFTLAMLAACTMAAYAQSPYGQLNDENDPFLKGRQVLHSGKAVVKGAKAPIVMAKAASADDGLTAMFDQPEGELQLMRRSGIDYLPQWGSPTPAPYEEKGTYVVKGTDGNYYFKNFVTNMCNGGAWVKGTVEGDIISVATGQICSQLWWFNGEENELFTYYLYALNSISHTEVDPYYGQEYEVWEYFPDFDVEAIQFKINADGSLTSLDDELLYGGLEYDSYGEEYTWPGYGDMGCSFFPFDEEPQTAPEGLTYTEDLMKYLVYSTDSYRFLDVAISGEAVYLKGLAEIMPEGIVKGQIEDGKVKFTTNQFMGVEQKYSTLLYLKTANKRVEVDEWGWSTYYFDECDDLCLSYDADTQSFGTSEGALLINAGKESVLHHEQYDSPFLSVWQEVAATPATPEWTYYMPFTEAEWGSWGYASFNLNTLDTKGNYILPEKLYYICYLDETPLPAIDDVTGEEYTEVSYNFSNNDFVGGGSMSHTIYFYTGDFERFGVQSVYYGADERRESPIWYYGDEKPADNDDPVSLSTTAQATRTLITDAQGCIRSQLGAGLNIVTITYADGSKKTAKLMIK